MDISYNFDKLQRETLESIKQVCIKKNVKGYIVGGAVRDAVLNVPPRDIDICFEVDPLELVAELDLDNYVYYDAFQTATITFKNGMVIDIIRCRKEIYKRDGSLPLVSPSILIDDLERRDFTVNAIAYDIVEGKIIDPKNGIKDIQNKIIRSVHNNSYSEDPTRIFRAVKYAVRYHFLITDICEIKKCIKNNIFDLISNERFYKEIFSICCEDKWKEILIQCNSIGIFDIKIDSLNKVNTLTDYKDINIRVLTFAYSVKDKRYINKISNNSYIQKNLKKSLRNLLYNDTGPLLLITQDNYEIYNILKNSCHFDRVFLCFDCRLVYKVINYLNYIDFKLNLDGNYVKSAAMIEGEKVGEVIKYITRIKLNTGLVDEKKYLNENLGEILNAIKYKN